jgi:hypothetical protein
VREFSRVAPRWPPPVRTPPSSCGMLPQGSKSATRCRATRMGS